MSYDLKDKVVLITGAAAGIGAGVVRYLMEEGVKHVAVLDIAEAAGIAFQNELNSKYGDNKVKYFNVDVTNDDQMFAAYTSVTKEHGYIDVVINNAGLLNDSYQTYRKQIQLNVMALVTSSLKAFELMRKDEGGKGGTIINVSSVAAFLDEPLTPIYNGTKAAVLQFSNCLGLDAFYSKSGVRVITICFGATNTPLLTSAKIGSFDKELNDTLASSMDAVYLQKMESAAKGVVDCCKLGESGSTWLSINDQPVKDISDVMKKCRDLFLETCGLK